MGKSVVEIGRNKTSPVAKKIAASQLHNVPDVGSTSAGQEAAERGSEKKNVLGCSVGS